MDDRGLAGRDGRGRWPPLARANGRIDDDRRARPEQRQGLLNGEVSPFEIGAYHHVEALLCHLFERQELAVTFGLAAVLALRARGLEYRRWAEMRRRRHVAARRKE